MNKQTIIERLKGLPILFPLLAAFHVVMFFVTVYGFIPDDGLKSFVPLGTCMEWLLYAFFWLNVSLQRRWAAIGYILFTAINLALQFLTPAGSEWKDVADSLFPFHILLCFFLLFYYKRFR